MSTANVNFTTPTATHPVLPTSMYYLPNGRVILATPSPHYPASLMVEHRGTTYFTQNLHSAAYITDSFNYNGTVYFAQPLDRALVSLPRYEEQEQGMNIKSVPRSYVRNGTTYFV